MILVDLIEFRFDWQKKKFVKQQTHKTNVPRAIAYSEKKKIQCSRGYFGRLPKCVRFKIVPNGQLQYSNCFNRFTTLTTNPIK